MKKLIFFGLLLTLVLCFVGCKETEVDQKPVFSGLEDAVVEKGDTFNPLEGVSVLDEEDGPIDVSAISIDNGGFNANVEGVYTFTYTVSDSYGNTTEATRKVEVVYTDVVAPILYGVQDKTIIVGDPSYSNLDGVTAHDNVDEDVTNAIVATGSVNTWVPGEYEVEYKVKDDANNEAETTRTITVGLGSFNFEEQNSLGTAYDNQNLTVGETEYNEVLAEVSGGLIDGQYADFALVKVVLKAKSTVAKELVITLAGATTSSEALSIGTESAEFVKYFRISETLDEAALTFVVNAGAATLTIEEISLHFGSAVDNEAPSVTIENNTDVYVPVGCPEAVVKTELLRFVSAVDNMDGNLTSVLDIDLDDADLSVAGEYTVRVIAEDRSGNVGELERKLVVAKARDTGIITDPGFDNETNNQFKNSAGGDGTTTLEFVDGKLVHTTTNVGNWPSANSPYISNLTTQSLKKDSYYMAKFDIKADVARQIIIRAGYELWDDPWIEDFAVGRPKYNVTTEWQTVYYIFKVEKEFSSAGAQGIKFELQFGAINYSDSESNNTIYIDDFQFYKLSNANENPVITEEEDIKTTYKLGDEAPDLKAFITADDLEDGLIEITDAMVNDGGLDMNTAGEYTVVYTVTDSEGGTATYELVIKVIEEEDTEGPVITIDPLALTFLEQTPPVQGVDLTEKIGQIAEYISIVDNVDGEIAFDLSMVDLDGLNLTSPAAGTYNIKIQTSDSSSNLSNLVELEITVQDKEPPKFIFAGIPSLSVGDTYNPFVGVVISDNLDGFSAVTLDNITGLDQFMNANGEVTASGEFQVTYEATDASGNEATKTVTFVVAETATEFYDGAHIDILEKVSWLSSGSETTMEESPDGGVVVNYSPSPTANYASGVHLKCNANIDLVPGETYKLVIEAKAEIAREFALYFVNSASVKITGFENGTVGKLILGMMEDYFVYEYVFTVENESASSCTFEIDLNYDDALGLANARKEQVLNFKQVKLYSTDGVLGTSEDLPKVVVFNDFEGYADDAAYQALDTDNIVGNRIGTGAFVKSKGQLVEEAGNKGLLQNFAYEGGSTNGIRVKINKADIPVNIQYLAFWVKASNISKVSKFQAFRYDAGGNHEEINSIIGDKENLLEGTFVYIPVSEIKSNTAQLSLVINVQSAAEGTLYFDDILLVEEKLTSYGSVVLEDFENYDSENTVVVGNRVGGSGFLPENGAVELDGENHLLVQDFAYDTNGTNGVRFKITKVDVPVGIKYIAVYMKASTDVGVTSFKAYCYNGGYEDISSSVIGDLTKLVDGTYVYIPVSMLKDNTTEVSMMINVGGSASGELSFDNLSLVKQFYVVEDPNEAPVISVDEEFSYMLHNLAFEEGENLGVEWLQKISVEDPEDGEIPLTLDMVDLGGLDLDNPIMGSYVVKIEVSDSKEKVAKLDLPVSIVKTIEDFEDFEDDEDFKENFGVLGFRVAGSGFLLEKGSLVVGAENNYIQQDYGHQLNGIKFSVNKADLVALGATYLGIYVRTSSSEGLDVFRAFGYDSTHHEIDAVGNAKVSAQGTYVYIKVADLEETYTSVSIQININNSSGTLVYDHIVIK
jgi:hypothetical protein